MKSEKRTSFILEKYKVFIILVLFAFSLFLRLWNITANGPVWDEQESAKINYNFAQLIRSGDFTNDYWWKFYPDHPRLTRYIYGAVNWLDIEKVTNKGEIIFSYDFIASRTLAAIFSSLSTVLIILYGWRYFNSLIGITSGIIFAMLPIFLGHSQISMFEPLIMFFFTASVFSFTHFLETESTKFIIITGILTGLAVAIKETNLMLIPLFVLQYGTFYYIKKPQKLPLFNKNLLYIFIIAGITFFLHWPMIWFHLDYLLSFTYDLRVTNTGGIPEILFGKLRLTTVFHYGIYFLTTTPFIILILFIIGSIKGIKEKQWIYILLLLWFLFPFILSFYPKREHGIRYIIQIYAPLSLLAGIGFNVITSYFTKKITLKFLFFIPIFLYLIIILYKISPYYLNYFNILVGGTRTVYEKRLLHMGWWGDGIKEAAIYVKSHAKNGDRVGIALSPSHTLPPIQNVSILPFDAKESYDYIIVNHYKIIRDGFNDTEIKKNYKVAYTVKADGAAIVTVYKK